MLLTSPWTWRPGSEQRATANGAKRLPGHGSIAVGA